HEGRFDEDREWDDIRLSSRLQKASMGQGGRWKDDNEHSAKGPCPDGLPRQRICLDQRVQAQVVRQRD
ncbi:MAG: hypothetical protein EB010_14470, partial [Acidimicrobiia bacterium]|nr:hypothetical protein [Acidimicrobiia bacterium]